MANSNLLVLTRFGSLLLWFHHDDNAFISYFTGFTGGGLS